MTETTRSVKVGLYIDSEETRKKLVSTHTIFSYAVRYYMELLLDMRGGDVYIRDSDGQVRLKKTSEYQESLVRRIKDAAARNGNTGELDPYDLEDFCNWCKEYYEDIMNASQPKGSVGILQNEQKKDGGKSSSGRSSKLVCQTRLFVDETSGLESLIDDVETVEALKHLKDSKKNSEKVACWIASNSEICKEKYPERKERIQIIADEYPIEMKRQEKKADDKATLNSRFGAAGLNFLPLIRNPFLVYQDECLGCGSNDIKNIAPWYYSAWAKAVQKLKSWNTWNIKAAENYESERKKEQDSADEFASLPESTKIFIEKVLIPYEKEKDQEISANTLPGESHDKYRLLKREIKGLDLVLSRMKDCQSYEKRIEILNELQSDKYAEIGDINLFRFIARDDVYCYVVDKDTCCKATDFHVKRNKILVGLERLQDHACLTLCDSNFSPAWTEYEGKKCGNSPLYSLSIDDNLLRMPLLAVNETGISVEMTDLLLRKSAQLDCFRKDGEAVTYIDPGTRASFSGVIFGGGKLQFNRKKLEKSGWSSDPSVKAYFNLSVTIPYDDSSVFKDYLLMKPKSETDNGDSYVGYTFSNSEKKMIFKSESKKTVGEDLHSRLEKTNFRVMAVDLGLRAQFSYSVMRLQATEEGTRFQYPVRNFESGRCSFAVHERSGQIRLLGDNPTSFVREKRKELENDLELMRYRIDAITYFRRLSRKKTPKERSDAAVKLMNRYNGSQKGWPYAGYSFGTLSVAIEKCVDYNEALWSARIDEIALGMKKNLSADFKEWLLKAKRMRVFELSTAKGSQQIGIAGISMWNIGYLTDVLNVMKKWHTLAEKSNQRSGIEKGERFAVALKQKIENLRELRIKETTDALVMTALGYEWVAGVSKSRMVKVEGESGFPRYVSENEYCSDPKRFCLYAKGKDDYRAKDGFWIKLHDSCDIIVFEELQKYRTDDERPSRENKMLMQWAHRSVLDQVRLQAEIHNVRIGQVGASFSSRFHAATGAPGVRGNVFDFDAIHNADKEISAYLSVPEADRRKGTLSRLARTLVDLYGNDSHERIWNILDAIQNSDGRYGAVIPQKGGEYFISLNSKGIPFCINADVNAAQNLARRWITRYDAPQKLTVNIGTDGVNIIDRTSRRISRVIEEDVFIVNGEINEEKFFDGHIEKSRQDLPSLKNDSSSDSDDGDEEGFDKVLVFRDVSGLFFSATRWVSSLKFWTTVRNRIAREVSSKPLLVRM